MYKRSNWDEDKLDIHSSGYAGRGSGGGGPAVGYAGHSSKDSQQDYHKNETYGANDPEKDNIKGSYSANVQEDDNKKKEDDEKDEEKEKTIVDAVEQEEKYKKEEEQEEEFKSVARDIQQSNVHNDSLNNQNNKETKKKNSKNIEEAINEAIKEEKEIVHVD